MQFGVVIFLDPVWSPSLTRTEEFGPLLGQVIQRMPTLDQQGDEFENGKDVPIMSYLVHGHQRAFDRILLNVGGHEIAEYAKSWIENHPHSIPRYTFIRRRDGDAISLLAVAVQVDEDAPPMNWNWDIGDKLARAAPVANNSLVANPSDDDGLEQQAVDEDDDDDDDDVDDVAPAQAVDQEIIDEEAVAENLYNDDDFPEQGDVDDKQDRLRLKKSERSLGQTKLQRITRKSYLDPTSREKKHDRISINSRRTKSGKDQMAANRHPEVVRRHIYTEATRKQSERDKPRRNSTRWENAVASGSNTKRKMSDDDREFQDLQPSPKRQRRINKPKS